MDRYWTLQTIGILQRVVAVIPCAAVLQCSELVDESVVVGDWTLCNAIHAIHVHSILLADAVPMNAGPVVP